MSDEVKIVSIVGVVVAILIGVVAYFAMKSTPSTLGSTLATPATNLTDSGQMVRSDSYSEGAGADAKVTLVEFGDFQCPACGAAYPNLKQLMQYYQGKSVRLVFRNFPLQQHANAQLGALAAEAAGEQGKYWEMFDKLYTHQTEWTADPPANKTWAQATTLIEGYAKDLGLDAAKFHQAVLDRKFNAKIGRDMADATTLAVSATPTFYVNGKQAQSISEVPTMIEAELAK